MGQLTKAIDRKTGVVKEKISCPRYYKTLREAVHAILNDYQRESIRTHTYTLKTAIAAMCELEQKFETRLQEIMYD